MNGWFWTHSPRFLDYLPVGSMGVCSYVSLILVVWSSGSIGALAEPLSPVQRYIRCYEQLTQTVPARDDPRLAAVARNTITAQAACQQVLDLASATVSGNDGEVTDPLGRKVVANFHHLHSTWFQHRDFRVTSTTQSLGTTKDMRDSTAPAAYYTRVLLDDSWQLANILTENVNLEPMRDAATYGLQGLLPRTLGPPGPNVGVSSPDDWMAALGPVVGFQERVELSIRTTRSTTGSMVPNQGGGVLGSSDYILMNIGVEKDMIPDGAAKLQRSWSKVVLKDFLCRELPVVRARDALGFVDRTASAPFRQLNSCASCHATIDPMAGVIRNLAPTSPSLDGGDFLMVHDTDPNLTDSRLAITVPPWVSQPDDAFTQRVPEGSFYYRSVSDSETLTNKPIVGLAGLGQAIVAERDYSWCTAYRYYRYFTGVELSFEGLQQADHIHAQRIRQLGDDLHRHGQTRKTVEQILSAPYYGLTDFGE